MSQLRRSTELTLSLYTLLIIIIIIIIIRRRRRRRMYIYHALINALSAHIIHINLNTIFRRPTHVEGSPTKTIYIKSVSVGGGYREGRGFFNTFF